MVSEFSGGQSYPSFVESGSGRGAVLVWIASGFEQSGGSASKFPVLPGTDIIVSNDLMESTSYDGKTNFLEEPISPLHIES